MIDPPAVGLTDLAGIARSDRTAPFATIHARDEAGVARAEARISARRLPPW